MNQILQLNLLNTLSIMPNNPIIYDNIIQNNGDINYDTNTGEITINKKGQYIINWWVATQSRTGASNISFALRVDGNITNNTDSPIINNSFSGFSYVNVNNVPIIMSLINNQSNQVFLSSNVTTKAELLIYELNQTSGECYAVKQAIHILKQVVDKYLGATVTIFTKRLASVTGTINSIFQAPDNDISGLFIIINSDSNYTAYPISELSAVYIESGSYDDTITYLGEPDTKDCSSSELIAIKNYLNIGDEISVALGVNATASGPVFKNEYGIILLLDDVNTNPLFLFNPNIYYIITTNTGLRNSQRVSIDFK